MKIRLCVIFLSLFVLIACAADQAADAPPTAAVVTEAPPPSPTATPVAAELQAANPWQDRIFYEIFVRSFYDSDGDGIGDINGLIEKLDYLNDGDPTTDDDLGVTGLWLMPVTEARSYHGYDVLDYSRVEADYGTRADFQRLMSEAHARGMIVIVDLVINHTSSQHPWFRQSIDPNSPFRDWYLWADEQPPTEGWHALNDDYYYGIFWDGMPDLNYRNPAVSSAVYGFSQFWLEKMGVDGFRLDAIKHLIEDGNQLENTPETIDWFVEYNDFVKQNDDETLLVGEVWSSTMAIAPYVRSGAVDLAFEFNLAESMVSAARGTAGAASAFDFALGQYPNQQIATFLTNHDQSRVVSQLFNDPERAKLAATIMLTSPGVPFIYYGEELGMEGKKPDELIRTPMQWSSAANGGFSSAAPWQPLNETWPTRNVDLLGDDPNSILNHYRRLITLRNEYDVLRRGDFVAVDSGNRKVHAHMRSGPDYAILTIVNGSREPVEDYALALDPARLSDDWQADPLIGNDPDPSPLAAYRPFAVLEPLSSHVILLTPPE